MTFPKYLYTHIHIYIYIHSYYCKKIQYKNPTPHSPTRTEVSDIFIDDSGVKALLHEPLQERIRTRHVNTEIWHVQIHPLKSLQEDNIHFRCAFTTAGTNTDQQVVSYPSQLVHSDDRGGAERLQQLQHHLKRPVAFRLQNHDNRLRKEQEINNQAQTFHFNPCFAAVITS